MSPSEINRAIAESMGWKFVDVFEWDNEVRLPKQYLNTGDGLPNYHGELNACAEFEKVLRNADYGLHAGCPRYVYAHHLYELVPPSMQPIMATAPQRCEAYLRTIGKWRDE